MGDIAFMELAYEQAIKARDQGEVPVGAVVVLNGNVIACGYNQSIQNNDPAGHAEIIALRSAAQKIANYRLVECQLYVTLEPCPMCAGAMVHSRINQLFYAIPDLRSGAAGSVYNLANSPHLNHQIFVHQGMLAGRCRRLLVNFFKEKRRMQKASKS